MREVEIEPISLDRLAGLLEPVRADRLALQTEQARALLGDRTVWNVNATATGGGVAEMLQALLAYGRGSGVDTRWLVINGSPSFFAVTKRLHNLLHGMPGDGGPLGDGEHDEYESVLRRNLDAVRHRVRNRDVVILHDPQSAGLVGPLKEAGAHVVWRSHIGRDSPNAATDKAWEFLRPYVEPADCMVFSRRAYAPDWVDPERLWVIPPSLDPFTAKNEEMSEADVHAVLRHTRLVDLPEDHGSLEFVRRDGSAGSVRDHSDLLVAGPGVPGSGRVVLQVSRWDRLKDMQGVLTGFTDNLAAFPDDVHLMLVGPDVAGVSDDPEGAEVLHECLEVWRGLPREAQRRAHLCCLPMDDVDENARMVNALQRYATVVVQKSLVEGFGLTVTEPMWKARPVVASKVGGISDQIEHGVSGLLLPDPTDLDAFASCLAGLLGDPARQARLGSAARERVRTQFLGDRHLIQYVELFARALAS